MSRTSRSSKRQPGRCRPRLEHLESRLPLTLTISLGGPIDPTALVWPFFEPDDTGDALDFDLSVVATDPAAGATLSSAPSSFSVTFDRPVDPFSASGGDILLQRFTGDDWVNLFDPHGGPTESFDPSGTVLTSTLPHPLAPGNYRLVLSGFSMLMGQDGSMPADPGTDQVLADFTVAQPGITLADAVPLGDPTAGVISVPGTLDLRNDPGAVALYRVTLPAGHFWRFGAEVQAQRIGSPLRPVLTVFDAQGQPIRVADTARPNTINDPYLFTGLAAGTYYVGVSGWGNVPGLPGGYDPATGTVGSTGAPQPGGAFTLNLVADQADAPVRLVGATVNHADPLDPTPTGLSLVFSGLLDLGTVRGDPSPGILLVNDAGQTFPMTAVHFDESTARYDFLFNWELPAGRYTVVVPDRARGGATDLSGQTPYAPGQPSGVLLSFKVGAQVVPHFPDDLGVLYDDVHQGVTRHDAILPGAAVTYRFVNPSDAPFQLTTLDTTGALGVRLIGGGEFINIPGGDRGTGMATSLVLKAGVYYLQFVNTGLAPTRVTWTLRETVSWESLVDTGVGQGPALNLRLVDPSGAGLVTSGVASSVGPAASGTQPGPVAPGPGVIAPIVPGPLTTNSPVTTGPAVAPAGLLLTLEGSPVGFPSVANAVAPSSGPGAAGESVGQGVGVGQGVDGIAGSEPYASGEVPADAEEFAHVPDGTGPIDGALVTAAVARPDELVLAAADWLTATGDVAARWLALLPRDVADESEAFSAAPLLLTRDDPSTIQENGHVQSADLGTPLVVGCATLLAVRYHRPLRRWLRRRRFVPPARGGRPLPLSFQGPHVRDREGCLVGDEG